MENKRRYKLYKHGKLWCCAAIAFATLMVGTTSLSTNAHADSATPQTTQVVNQPQQTSNEVPVDQTTRNNNVNANLGSLDSCQVTTNANAQNVLQASGWQASGESNNQRYRYAILYDNTAKGEVARQQITPVNRPDVQAAYPNVNNSANSGFNVSFNLPDTVLGHSVSLVTRYSDDAVYGEGQRTDYWFAPITIANTNLASLDNLAPDQNGNIHVTGWHASNQANGKKYHYIIAFDQTRGYEIARQAVSPVQRPDVAKVYPTIGNASKAGFDVSFKLTPQYARDNVQFISRWTADPAGNGDSTTDFWFNPVTKINRGHLDSWNLSTGQLQVSGWHANDAAIYQPYHYLILFDNTSQRQVAAVTVPTTASGDIANAYRDTWSAGNARFNYQFNSSLLTAGHSYSLISRYSTNNQGNGDDGIATDHTDYWYPAMMLNQSGYAIDSYQITDNNVMSVNGWFANDAAIGKSHPFVIVLQNGTEVARQAVTLTPRVDVAFTYPNMYNSKKSGFATAIQLPANVSGNLSFVLRFSDQANGEGNCADIYTNQITNGFAHNRMIKQGNRVFYYDANGRRAYNFLVDGVLYRTDLQGNITNNVNNNLRIGQITFNGDLAGISKNNRKPVQISIRLTDGTTVDGYATVKWQGDSSLNWPKKGYRIKLFKDQAMTKKLKIKLPGTGFKTSNFNLKSCYTDATAGLNIVNAQLFSQITASRPGLKDSIVNTMPHAGQIAGVPLELNINALDQGLYVLETYQEDKLYDLDDKKGTDIALSDNQLDIDLSRFNRPATPADLVDTAFNNRSPEKVDQAVADRFNELYRLANASDADYSNLESQYLDVPAAIDYLAFIGAINDVDGITKNITYISKAGSKWVLMPYDLDMTWDNRAEGATMPIDTVLEDVLNSYQQRLLLNIYNHHKQDVINRYKELRQTVLSSDNVISLFNQWFNTVGNAAYQNDQRLWDGISTAGATRRGPINVNDFNNMIRQRLANVDHSFGLN